MTRKGQIQQAAHLHDYDDVVFGEIFAEGARWADAHPHWISVEDDLPPIGRIVLVAIPLGCELSVLPLSILKKSDFECLSGMTHWMPLPAPPTSDKTSQVSGSSSEKPNNCKKKGGKQ